MVNETAFRSSDPAVIEAFHKYKTETEEIVILRDRISAEQGRRLMASRLGFQHGTQIVGFERLATDTDGDLLADGALIVSSKKGTNKGMVVPNIKRKAGQALAGTLRTLSSPPLDVPGMPAHHIYSDGSGMRAAAPAMWVWDDVVYALWPTDTVTVGDNWERIPLSTYHLAMEQHEAGVSGNPEGGA